MDMFDTEWDASSQKSSASQLSEMATLCDEFPEVAAPTTGRSSDCEDPGLDLVLTASSLTEASCFSLRSEFDFLDEDVLSTVESVEDSRCGETEKESDGTIQSSNRPVNSTEAQLQAIGNETGNHTNRPHSETVQDIPKGGSISYAQLFFDPESKALVTLMEIAADRGPGHGDRGTTGGNHCKSARDCRSRSRSEKHKIHSPRRETPLHWPSVVVAKNSKDERSCYSVVSRGSETSPTDTSGVDDRQFQDETLSTECSSLSSRTCRKRDPEEDRKENEAVDWGDDWGFPCFETPQLEPPVSPIRYLDEPIVFSNDCSMEEPKLCWLDEANIGLYLLHDCDDPWDYGGSTRGARCGESLKRLLSLTRLCVSLTQLGESKWRASSGYHRASNFPNHNGNHQKAKVERTAYSVLNDV
jgi:hypothetical protein